MIPIEHNVELLVRLGLNFTQAKIFLALCTEGMCTARAIAESSGVAREVVYQVIPMLQQKGLIETVISSPQAYRAIPIEHAFEILVKQKSEEKKKLLRDVKEGIKSLKKLQKGQFEESSQVVVFPQGKALRNRILSEIKKAQVSVDAIVSWPEFVKYDQHYVNDKNNETVRKAKVRILLHRNLLDPKLLCDTLIGRNLGFGSIEFRVSADASLVNMMIYDDKKMFIEVSEADKAKRKTPSLFTNSTCLIQTATCYFGRNWKTATPLKKKTKKTCPDRLFQMSEPTDGI